MSSLAMRVNAEPELATIPITSREARNQFGTMPVLATPAPVVTFAAGMGLVASVAGLFSAGYAVGRAIGSTEPVVE